MGCCTTLLKCIFSPIILLWFSLRNYCFPCVGIYLRRCCCCCFASCSCCAYKDKKFKPDNSSLGDYSEGGATEAVEWRSAVALGHDEKMMLFCGKIEPRDIQQGNVGNCWLMSAFACLAEHPGVIQRCFVTKEFSKRGKYTVRIYDKPEEKWVEVSVDDLVPCAEASGRPLFAQPHGNEMWVMLYEKAFAKYCGSYAGLSGGNTVWALQAMTGDAVFKVMREKDGSWRRFDLVYLSDEKNKRKIGLRASDEDYSPDKIFTILWEYDTHDATLAASSEAGADTQDSAQNGIVQGHAYSILRVTKVDDFRLVQLRNPWGQFEWRGDWSDTSSLWKAYPDIAKELNWTAEDDGTFWMSFDDVITHFRNFDICDRTTGFDDLQLDVHEERGPCGACYGCCCGCLGFWCLCRGLGALLCGRKSTGVTRKGRTCCGRLCC
eukprot:NODE_192_length_1663_cov_367.282528_g130_i0.p1 GENE.NODE_192_length_1663_cov_367.282528_g130_i0~~NODE_192_length_1663_cov_367.282528_g130_i0.p1  ORF type:complete len:434 (-),score=113.49 NODE_192_length_1663_cov_367.282528_g130_i0:280-1581(-)